MYRNPEHYPDPTARAALCQLRRKENRLNTGKQFEADWKKSMPPDAWCYRLKDSAATSMSTVTPCTTILNSRPSKHPASR